MSLSIDEIKLILEKIPDPEIPVVTIEELGILRRVEMVDGLVNVFITPTYSGCPATDFIEKEIKVTLLANNINNFKINHQINPAWTTDWITEEAKEKLENYGIAPPVHSSMNKKSLTNPELDIRCPQCKSKDTKMVSHFGSTACKALYKCNECKEPFDYFKCL